MFDIFLIFLLVIYCSDRRTMDFAENKINDYEIIFKTELSFAFMNHRPFLPYHILVSPIRIVSRYKDLTQDESSDLAACIKKLVKGLKTLGTAWNVNLQDGKEAGQTVSHVHWHLLARNAGDHVKNNVVYYKIDDKDQIPLKTPEELKASCDFIKDLLDKNGFIIGKDKLLIEKND
jgi:bis(5'-adenosyl)-triphosphatase